jgi:hypothetical protein
MGMLSRCCTRNREYLGLIWDFALIGKAPSSFPLWSMASSSLPSYFLESMICRGERARPHCFYIEANRSATSLKQRMGAVLLSSLRATWFQWRPPLNWPAASGGHKLRQLAHEYVNRSRRTWANAIDKRLPRKTSLDGKPG